MRGTKLILAALILAAAICMIAPEALAAVDCAAAMEALTPAGKPAPAPVASAWLLASVCYTKMERAADAERVLREGLSAHPADRVLERALGELLMHEHFDSSEAGQLLERAVQRAPGDPESRHYYAQWAYMNSRERVCAAQERAALRLPGLNNTALLQMNTLLAMCAGRLEDAAGARAAFRRANEINLREKTYDPVAAWQYVQFLGRFGEDAEAQTIVSQILARAPDFGPARLERAKYFDRSGQPDKAVEEAGLVLQSAGNDFNVERAAHGILARSFAALGRKEDAAREQAWIEAHPNPETPR